jgi:hypothetical protein
MSSGSSGKNESMGQVFLTTDIRHDLTHKHVLVSILHRRRGHVLWFPLFGSSRRSHVGAQRWETSPCTDRTDPVLSPESCDGILGEIGDRDRRAAEQTIECLFRAIWSARCWRYESGAGWVEVLGAEEDRDRGHRPADARGFLRRAPSSRESRKWFLQVRIGSALRSTTRPGWPRDREGTYGFRRCNVGRDTVFRSLKVGNCGEPLSTIPW